MAKKAKKAIDNLKKSKKMDKMITAQQPQADELPTTAWKRDSTSFYEERFDEIAYELACRGLTQKQIAARFGIADRTLRKWMQQNSSLQEALDAGYAVAVGNVENALYRASTGFTYEEEVVNKDGEVVTLRKYEKPNITAMIFYLCNRDNDSWKNVNRVEHTAEDGKPLTVYFDIPRPENSKNKAINTKAITPEIKESPQGK
jgi:transcriptional regulator with XRE-family HTH domain